MGFKGVKIVQACFRNDIKVYIAKRSMKRTYNALIMRTHNIEKSEEFSVLAMQYKLIKEALHI